MDRAPLPPPRVLGRYALYDAIASGGMASVHLGRLLGPVGFARTVAIKRLHAQFAQDPEFVSMFLDEARVVARIHHPNVVPTLDVVAADHELFIVMEYVQGDSLARLIKTTVGQGMRIAPPLAATMLSGVLHGLHAAHEARSERGEPLNVVHRDISPQNVLVGIDGVARVLDFGIAKASGRTQWTKEGQVKGKLGYMAPEQIMGKVDRRTDVYAASVVLWEALAGKRLFFGENDPHVTKLVLEGRVDPASEHAPDVPPLLDAIVMRGLSREPADRFPTARDMALALEEAMPPVTASKIGAWVEATARMTLEDRTGRIAVIESDSSPEVPQATAVDAPTLLSNALMSSDAPASPVVRSNRTRLFWGAGSLALVLAAVFTYRRGTAEMPMAASAPPSTASSSAPPPQAAKVPEPAVLLASEAASVSAPIPAASTMARPTRRPLSKPPAVRNPRVDDGTSDRK